MARQRPGDDRTGTPEDVTAPGGRPSDSATSAVPEREAESSAAAPISPTASPSTSGSGSADRASRAPRRPTARKSGTPVSDPAGDPARAVPPPPEPQSGSGSGSPEPVVTPETVASGKGTPAGSATRWKRPRVTRTTTRTRKTSQGTWIGYSTTRRQVAWVLTGVLALAIIVAAVLISRDDDPAAGDTAFVDPVVDQPQGLTEDQLRAFGAEHAGPVYWAGPRAGTTYELTLTSADEVFVRYLPPGVALGSDQANYLTVATYTRPGAYQALREVATGSTFTSEETASGAFVVYAVDAPTSAHFSFPDTDLQVEVYDPEPGRAVDLVLDGSITLLR